MGLCVLGAGPKMHTNAGAGDRKPFILFYFFKSKTSINGVLKGKINQSQNCRPWQRSNVFFSIPKRANSKKLKSQTFPLLCVKKELVNLETQHFLDKKYL